MSGMPIVISAQPRYSVSPGLGGSPSPTITINGGASAGSRRVLTATDAQAEQARLDFDTADNVRTVRIAAELGQGSHTWSAMVVFDAEDDTSAAARFEAGGPEVKRVFPGLGPVSFTLDAGATTCYVLVQPAYGATVASCTGRVYVEGASHG